ncbi:helix-turn-helix domain-containing protein [Ruegeria sp. YS9]|uniref:helix-turn-helix domain-containing protein n=1 Tax=Ruegeria sp. YS9 TaxID=2966453 RepID=UPI00214C6614|nr:helix-turn-helix transcriptional regulator [Ruegeria sp. YS9]UUV08702.1 helix-turn-helix domain-containing protein [Ruegeria sp. YS9]
MTNSVDQHVGRRIRVRRWYLGLTQTDLAEIAGVRFQQIQKYETGKDRVSASRLFRIAEGLETEVAFFFDGLGDETTRPAPPEDLINVLQDKEAIELVKAYYNIPKELRERLFSLARVLAS